MCSIAKEMLSDTDVVQRATEYFTLMADLTDPNDLCFRTFSTDGVPGLRELCDLAASRARGGDNAVASLVLTPGDTGSFCIDGTHARGTLCTACTTPHTRTIVLVTLLAVVIMITMFFLRR